MSERDFADALDRWLRQEGMVFRRDRTDKKTTCIRGWPDFEIVARNRVLLIEVKSEKGTLSRDQKNLHLRFQASGTTVHVCRRIEDAVQIVQEWRGALPPLSAPLDAEKTPTAGAQAEKPRLLMWCGQTWVAVQDRTHGRSGWSLLHKATPEEIASLEKV